MWQLPLTADQLPRFGEYEKERLWELFKQQKKERRKKVKPGVKSDGTTKSRNQSFQDDSGGEANYGENESYLHQELAGDESQIEEETPNISQRNSGSLHPAPPPGFSVSDVSSPRTSEKAASQLLEVSKSLDQMNFTEKMHGAPAPRSLSSTSSSSTESPPQQYPSHFPTDTSDASFAAHVATIFIQSLSQGQIEKWLFLYVERASSTLMVGQAQAVCSTPDERRQQWTALQQPFWECQGWAMQSCGTSRSLLVLTGRTMQPTGTFYYNLTVILTPQYQIQNTILSFSLIG